MSRVKSLLARRHYLMAAVAAHDDDDGDDGGDIPGRAGAEDKPLPRCRTRPPRTFDAGDADDDGAVGAAVAVAVAVALAQCPQTLAIHPRPRAERRRALAPRWWAPPRTNCHHCCAAGVRIPRADSRARNCCARSCVRGASRVPASFQPVPLSPVAVDRVSTHVICLDRSSHRFLRAVFVDPCAFADDEESPGKRSYMSRRR